MEEQPKEAPVLTRHFTASVFPTIDPSEYDASYYASHCGLRYERNDHWLTFFAMVDKSKTGRLYVGVGAPGRALRAVSVRGYATMLAAIFAPFVPDDSPQPRTEVAGDIEASNGLPGGDECVLDQLARPILMAGQHAGVSEKRLVVIADQFGKSGAVHVGW